uniref:1-acylglycerol-3-phosphate O-acyltransferase n=1 Tax=Setaria italica TaxID=4555 RepID=K3ZEU9_SETIT
MEIPALLTVLPIDLLFLLSGLAINAVQAVVFLSIRPLSMSLHRRINGFLAELLWLQPVWLLDWWAGVKVKLHADPETHQLMGKEHALVISNHRGDIDWLIGWILAQRSGCLGSALPTMKKSSKFLPVIGWSMWFSEYIFLEGSWAKDQNTINWGLQRLKNFPRLFWLALSQEYAASQGLPSPRNVLIPRTKIHVHVKRHAMGPMPKSDEDVSRWCKDIFVVKDALLDKHMATGTFGDEIRPLGKSLINTLYPVLAFPAKTANGWSTMVVLSWPCLLLHGAYRFFEWTQLLSTWKGALLPTAVLALVAANMHFFITVSQSARPSSTTAASQRGIR